MMMWLWSLGVTAVLYLLLLSQPVSAQPTTMPPSSLPTHQLSGADEASLRPSCELCRPAEKRPGSDLQRYRHRRAAVPQPHKKPAGVHGSINGGMKATLPTHRLRAEDQEAPAPITDQAAHARDRGRNR